MDGMEGDVRGYNYESAGIYWGFVRGVAGAAVGLREQFNDGGTRETGYLSAQSCFR